MYRNVEQYKIEKGKFTYGLEIEDVPNDIAEKLKKEFKLEAEHVRYHVDGTWYSQMNDFPCILFDRFGYIIFKTYQEFISYKTGIYHKNCDGIYIGENHIQIDQGIHLLNGYTLYPYAPNTFVDMKMEIANAEKRRVFIKKQEVAKLKHTESLRLLMQNAIIKSGGSSQLKEF